MLTLNSGPAPKWRIRLLLGILAVTVASTLSWFLWMTQMPLRSFAQPLPSLTAGESERSHRLAEDVRYLSVTIGDRSFLRPHSLQETTNYLSSRLQKMGYEVTSLPYSANGLTVNNLEAKLSGTDSSLGQVIVAAHYDSVAGTVGANDNGTGVAAVLEIAQQLKQSHPRRTIRFVLFVNEEPPFFQTELMGSNVYARQLRKDGVPVAAMISIETIGFYSDLAKSQKYPPVLNLFYPDKGNFIAFIGNTASRDLVRDSIRSFRETASLPSQGIAAPATGSESAGPTNGPSGSKATPAL
jgi:hypothetical protein